jgi:acid phosphatase family membrane protein YuiD
MEKHLGMIFLMQRLLPHKELLAFKELKELKGHKDLKVLDYKDFKVFKDH